MDYSVISDYPLWYFLLCVIAGLLASLYLYYRDQKNEFPKWLKRLLGVNRFILVALISFLLLSPLLKLTSRSSEKPIIVVAQDNSRSLVLGPDSAYYRTEYLSNLNAMLDDLGEDFEISLFTFGDEVNSIQGNQFDSLSFDETQTDMSALFDMMDVRFVNRNLGALIIASDGIFNQGLNPLYQSLSYNYPVYTIAMGDTSIRRDAFLKRVHYNRIAYEGNDFPVEVIINANKMQGGTLTIKISENGSLLHNKQIAVDANNFSKTLRFNLTAGDPGTHHFRINLSANLNELTLKNNTYNMFVDVLQSKQKILILANSPHPDISALKDAISNNINYEVTDFVLSDFKGPLKEYSLIILHQLPSDNPASTSIITQITRTGIPVMYILGEQSSISYFNGLKAGIQLNPYNNNGMNEALAVFNENFINFTISDGLQALVPSFPPLNTRFSRYNTNNDAGALFFQKLGNVESKDPLWIFSTNREIRTAVVVGTGLWKWRMKCWTESGDHNLFNDLIHKSIQYLALKEDKRRFRIIAAENIPENRDIELQAELYNESLEPINDPDVSLEITDEDERTYNYVFGRSAQAYSLIAGRMPVGTYTYSASVAVGDKVFSDQGGFTVSPVVAERINLRASHALLEKLSAANDGQTLNPDEIMDIPDILNNRGDVKPLIHAEKKYIEFIDIWWILVLIIALLGLEWFLRKWSGSY